MIIYFSGTGNTKFVAEYIADHIGDECIDLKEVLKYKMPLRFNSIKPFVFAAPIYAWGFPEIVKKAILKSDLTDAEQIYFIGTMASQSGDFDKALEKIAYGKNMAYMGSCGVPMPNNYIRGGNIQTKEQAEEIIKGSLPLLNELSEQIGKGEMIEKYDKTPFAPIASGVVNSLFNKFFISSEDFNVSEKCNSCGQCIFGCPVNNIKLITGGILEFGRYCINCYSCINRCPKRAINIGKKTIAVNRYVCPEYSDWKERGLV